MDRRTAPGLLRPVAGKLLPPGQGRSYEAPANAGVERASHRWQSSGAHPREGQPAETVVALAEDQDADLVVVGSRRMGRVRRLIAGSVSEGVVHRASCPVLIVCGG